jgi:hypothetical protein
MKLKTISITAFSFLAAGALFFTACQRDRDTDTTEGQDIAFFEKNTDDDFNLTEQASTGNISSFKKSRGACDVITFDTLSTPKKITIDFGSANCLCGDGKNRRGKIIRTFTGKFKDVGSVHTVTYDNYFVNDNNLKGVKTITNNGPNSAGNLTYNIDVKDTVIKANGAGTATWMSNRVREYFDGYNTPIWSDDKFRITGSASGTRANGNSFSMNITTPIIVDLSCPARIISGVVSIQPQGKALRTLDYGNSTCDNQATVTINNKVFTIQIK